MFFVSKNFVSFLAWTYNRKHQVIFIFNLCLLQIYQAFFCLELMVPECFIQLESTSMCVLVHPTRRGVPYSMQTIPGILYFC